MESASNDAAQISVREAAQILSLSTVYVHKLISQNQLRVVAQEGRKRLLLRSEVMTLKAKYDNVIGARRRKEIPQGTDEIIQVRISKEHRRLLELYLQARGNGIGIEHWIEQKIDAAVQRVASALGSAGDDL
jgi:excisionase family DNA binding protein